jgi:hypothetical protein
MQAITLNIRVCTMMSGGRRRKWLNAQSVALGYEVEWEMMDFLGAESAERS